MRFALLSVLAATASASMASDFAKKDGVSLRGREPRELKTHKGPHVQTSAMLADEGSAAQQFMTTNKGKAKAERQGTKPNNKGSNKAQTTDTSASPAAVETGSGGASNFNVKAATKERTKTPRVKEAEKVKPENFKKAEKVKRVKEPKIKGATEEAKPEKVKVEKTQFETKEKKPKKEKAGRKGGEDAAIADTPVSSTAPPKVAAAPETTVPATSVAASTTQAVATQPATAAATQPATTTIAAATTVPPLSACPATYDPSSTQYVEGSEIQMNGHIFKCLEDPYEAYCGIESIDAAWDDAQKQLWQNSWEHVGPCDMAAVTTTAPESTTEATAAETSTAPPQVAAAPDTSEPTWSPTGSPTVDTLGALPAPATTAFPSVTDVATTTTTATTTATTAAAEDVDSPTSYPTWMPTETPPPCPPAYDDARTDYVAGEEVEVYEHTFSCNSGTGYVDFCNIAAVDSLWTDAELAMWNGAWVHVGPCTVPE
ncbi:hypothetical protein ACHAXT_011652 [Thalassiosira profunda]